MEAKPLDAIFTYSSIAFNILVSILYLVSKFGNMPLTQVIGIIILLLTIPFTITLLGYIKVKESKKTIISNMIILLYFSLEILLDYVLKISFRDMLTIHVLYILVLYAALFSMMAISWEKNRKTGRIVVATFIILMTCLAYYLAPL